MANNQNSIQGQCYTVRQNFIIGANFNLQEVQLELKKFRGGLGVTGSLEYDVDKMPKCGHLMQKMGPSVGTTLLHQETLLCIYVYQFLDQWLKPCQRVPT